MLVFSLSVLIGLVMGTLGAGGSIMTTPLFLYVENMPPVEAIASSLIVVAVATAFGLRPCKARSHPMAHWIYLWNLRNDQRLCGRASWISPT